MFGILAGGCGGGAPDESRAVAPKLTPTSVRADRRFYDGAPPVIPHPPMPGPCASCHTTTGRSLPGMGAAPANPHAQTAGIGQDGACQQCHVFRNADTTFAGSLFTPLKQEMRPGSRAYSGAPPVTPHPLFMREDCRACHAGLAARPEITCDHAERANCLQCHLRREQSGPLASFAGGEAGG